MRRIVILGRGAAGKSTLAARLGAMTALPVIELDRLFWLPGLAPHPRERWIELQRELIEPNGWIIDGDLGQHDALEVRLQAADTMVVLDLSLVRCAWRALRRSRERFDFWRWLWSYRRRSLSLVLAAIATHAPMAELHVLRTPADVERFIDRVARELRIAA